MGYNYNGKLKSAEILLHSAQLSMIRRERPEGLLRHAGFQRFAEELPPDI